MSTPLNIGVIGLGRMGKLYAHTLATQVPGINLYGVTDVSEQARTAIADEFGVPHTTPSAHELIALPHLDAVVSLLLLVELTPLPPLRLVLPLRKHIR